MYYASLTDGNPQATGEMYRLLKESQANDPDKSTSSIVKTIEGLSAKDSGRFVDYKGDPLPW